MYSITIPSLYSDGKGMKNLVRCLESMKESMGSKAKSYEVCLYLQQYPTESVDEIKELIEGMNVKLKTTNQIGGLVKSHNHVYKMSSNDLILNIDDDFIFQKGSMEFYDLVEKIMNKQKALAVMYCVQNSASKKKEIIIQNTRAFWKTGGIMFRRSAFPKSYVVHPELPAREDAFTGFFAYSRGYSVARIMGCPTIHRRHRVKTDTKKNGRSQFKTDQWEKALPGMTVFRRRSVEPINSPRAHSMSYSKECKDKHKELMDKQFGFNDIDEPEKITNLLKEVK